MASARIEEVLKAAVQKHENQLHPSSELGASLHQLLHATDSPLDGLKVSIEQPNGDVELGYTGEGSHTVHTHEMDDPRGTKAKIEWWLGETGNLPSNFYEQISEVIEAYWKPDFRSESAGLIDTKRDPEVVQLAENTIASALGDDKTSIVLFCDLDNFGEVNKAHSQETGDTIIQEFGQVIEKESTPDALPLHHGGDEFLCLLPGARPSEGLQLAFDITRATEEFEFSIQEPPLTCSIGISTTVTANRNFQELAGMANEGMKEAKDFRSGTARFGEPKDHREPISANDYRKLATCIAKSSLTSRSPFSNPWLNLLSDQCFHQLQEKEQIVELQEEIEKFLDWAEWEWERHSGETTLPQELGFDPHPSSSKADIAFVAAHAVYRFLLNPRAPREAAELHLQHSKLFGSCRLEIGDTTLWEIGDTDNLARDFNLGLPYRLPEDDPKRIKAYSTQSLLIKVGHDPITELGLAESLFSDIIVVDDRPTRGGGLPDFWEATIAMLVDTVVRDENIKEVFAVGNREYAERTFEWLEKIDEWPEEAEYLSYKTSRSSAQIRETSERLDSSIHFADEPSDVLDRLYELVQSGGQVEKIDAAADEDIESILKRTLDSTGQELALTDGCSVRTVAEAYPTVLEIARNAESESITDQAGRSLKELTDFKIRLEEPGEDATPAFYTNEKENLEAYYSEHFEDSSGLFRSRLEENNQLSRVLEHLCSVIDAEQSFATRRAILVIPHIPEEGEELSPLGLVSIRIIPRFKESRVDLSFSYTWRTVEALVGLPYSLYGSVQFSQHLIQLLQSKRGDSGHRDIRLGFLNYIAHSLHIFADPYGQDIARTIVNEVSF